MGPPGRFTSSATLVPVSRVGAQRMSQNIEQEDKAGLEPARLAHPPRLGRR